MAKNKINKSVSSILKYYIFIFSLVLFLLSYVLVKEGVGGVENKIFTLKSKTSNDENKIQELIGKINKLELRGNIEKKAISLGYVDKEAVMIEMR